MFNEAFWFFYWVNVVAGISSVFHILAGVTAVGAIMCFGPGYTECREEDEACWLNRGKWLSIGAATLLTLSFLIPPEEAFYAGAGQYVAESAELDETLLKLKEAIDEKIEDLIDEPD